MAKGKVKPSLCATFGPCRGMQRCVKCKAAASATKEKGNPVRGICFDDLTVAGAISDLLHMQRPSAVYNRMRMWEKPILKVPIPGPAARARKPSQQMLNAAKRAVLNFYKEEEALGARSDVAKAFHMASREQRLRFEWADACRRVKGARLDCKQKVDTWSGCLAMNTGSTCADCEIYVCGTRPITLCALTSLLCHEGLHNLARRTRQGNPYLAEDTEHIAMALIGDPQIAQ